MSILDPQNDEHGQWWEDENGRRFWRAHPDPERSRMMRESANIRYNSEDYLKNSLYWQRDSSIAWLESYERDPEAMIQACMGGEMTLALDMNTGERVENPGLPRDAAEAIVKMMEKDRRDRLTKVLSDIADKESGITVRFEEDGLHYFSPDGEELVHRFKPKQDRSKWKKVDGPHKEKDQ